MADNTKTSTLNPFKFLGKVAEDGYKWFMREGEKRRFSDGRYEENYFSGSDVGIYIGDKWVDDIVSLQYGTINNKAPMYGYASTHFDAVGKGTTIVQGQFGIVFSKSEYFKKILENYQAKIDGVKNVFESVDQYGYVTAPFGGYIRSEGFDIVVYYGDDTNQIRGGTIERIESVHVTSITKACDVTGEPIMEVYSFFGRKAAKGISDFETAVDDIAQAYEALGELPEVVAKKAESAKEAAKKEAAQTSNISRPPEIHPNTAGDYVYYVPGFEYLRFLGSLESNNISATIVPYSFGTEPYRETFYKVSTKENIQKFGLVNRQEHDRLNDLMMRFGPK